MKHGALAIALGVAFLTMGAAGQNAATPEQGGVTLVKLAPPTYPVIARTAHVAGDLQVLVLVRKDGTVESAEMVSGPQMLKKAALDSAEQSQFECRGCSGETTAYEMVYSFQLEESCCTMDGAGANGSVAAPKFPHVSQSGNHVTVVDEGFCTCDAPNAVVHVRSIRCLYLWKCGRH